MGYLSLFLSLFSSLTIAVMLKFFEKWGYDRKEGIAPAVTFGRISLAIPVLLSILLEVLQSSFFFCK